MYETLSIVFIYGSLIAFTSIALCTGIYAFILWYRSTKVTYVKIVLTLTPLTALTRAIWAAIFNPDELVNPLLKQSVYALIFGGLVGYLFFSVYCSIGLIWLILFHKIRATKITMQSSIKYAMIIANIIVYLIWIILIICILTSTTPEIRTIWHTIEAMYHASLNIIAALISGFYGIIIYKSLSKEVVKKEQNKLEFKVGMLTCFCTIVLVAQGVEIILATFLELDEISVILTVIYVAVEGIAEIFVVVIFSIKDERSEANENDPLIRPK